MTNKQKENNNGEMKWYYSWLWFFTPIILYFLITLITAAMLWQKWGGWNLSFFIAFIIFLVRCLELFILRNTNKKWKESTKKKLVEKFEEVKKNVQLRSQQLHQELETTKTELLLVRKELRELQKNTKKEVVVLSPKRGRKKKTES
jgi:MFS family permease